MNTDDQLKEIAKEIRKTITFDYTAPTKELAKHVIKLEGLSEDKAIERAKNLLYTRSKYK